MTEQEPGKFSEKQPSATESPLHKMLADRKAHLKPEQARQFAERIRSAREIPVAGGIPRQPVGATKPLSFSQERLWFLQQLDPEDRSLIRPVAVRLAGELNVALLEQSLTEISRRHEVLRATFDNADGSPQQRTASVCPIRLRVKDLSNLPIADRDLRTRAILKEGARELFDLSAGPIFRGTLVRWGMKEHVLLLVTHHIVFDAWSSEVLIDEVFTVYGQLARDSEPSLAALPITYADCARWQRQQYEVGTFDDSLEYWVDTLRDFPDRVELPTDRPRQAIQAADGACERLHLSPNLVRDLESLARAERTTLFSVLLAAFAILIKRYTGMEDFLIGTPVAGRGEIETENLIGRFVNTLALRCNLSGDPTGHEVVGRIRETVLNALEHQDVPFEKVIEAVHPDRELGRAPLFDVMFNLENVPHQTVAPPGLTVEPYALDVFAVGTDLVAEIRNEADGALTCEFAYRTALFDRETIQRALEHYKMLLQGIAGDAHRSMSEIPMLPAWERHRLLVEWNDTKRAYPENRCIHELFEDQVRQSPDAPAVTFGDETLTYCELNQRANQLAHRLRRIGVGPDIPVGICVERSNEMLVGILAILKAGGAYVPLDPVLPLKRLQFMSSDADLRLILTQARLVPKLSSLPTELLCIDNAQATTDKVDLENPSPIASPDNLLCVFYTSGSTGKPKGVMLTHRGVVNHLIGVYATLGVHLDDAVLQSASPAFDMSLRGLIGPLIYGARAVLLSKWQSKDPLEIVSVMQTQNVTAILGIVPSLLSAVVDTVSAQRARIPTLRLIATGGETHSRKLAQKTLATFGRQVQLYNLYGPTEGTGISTAYRIEDVSAQATSIPIGRPLPNVNVYVLDRFLHLAGIGIPGELYLAGLGVAKGYVNRPELTAEQFIQSPFDSDDILYKTGDRGRWLASRELEFLGRADRQIKLRGYRIELGEIEAALCEHPSIRQAVATINEPEPGEGHLVAYVVLGASLHDAAAFLQEHLKERLPRYMIPSQFVVLDTLPLTARGKVDYSALPRPSSSQRSLTKPFAMPRTPFEKAIAAIWKEILHVDRIGVHDNFFDLGGHSLSLMRVAAAIDRELGARPSLRALYKAPTVEGQSVAVLRECDRLDGPKEVEDH